MDPRAVTDDAPRRLTEHAARAAAAQLANGLRPLPDDEDQPLPSTRREFRWIHIPNRFRWVRVDDLNDRDLHDEITKWAAITGPLPNLVLFGPTGTGKTFAAIAAGRVRFEAGDEVQFWPVVELLDSLRPGGDPDIWDAVVHDTDLLILDDLGASRVTDWTDERLYAIVNRRWLDEKPTIVTTNYAPDALADAIGARMFSRLIGGALVLAVGGPDRRLTP